MRTQKQIGRRHSQRGIAMAIALFALTAFIIVVASSTLVGSADIRATRDYRRTAQVHFVAESGILHAIQVANQAVGIGVENFQNDVVDNWNTSWTPSTKTFTALPGFTYSVLALPNDANSGYFRATAFGPESATNTVVASVSRSVIPSTAPGALHLANAGNTNCTFTGNGFSISGNDENYSDGSPGPGAPVPGLSTLNATNAQEAINSLNNQEKHDVTGLGFSSDPLIPSVRTSPGAPSADQIDAMVASLLSDPNVVNQAGVTSCRPSRPRASALAHAARRVYDEAPARMRAARAFLCAPALRCSAPRLTALSTVLCRRTCSASAASWSPLATASARRRA